MINTHIEHVEDLILLDGGAGLDKSLQILYNLSTVPNTLNITTKWDGCPAIVCGKDPENGKFFISTKSIFNKTEKNICYSEYDINKYYPNISLNHVLKRAFQCLSELKLNGIFQGDLLYLDNELKDVIIGGVEYVTFQPNTLMYAIRPFSTQLINSKIGIAFHTEYECKSLRGELSVKYPMTDISDDGTSCWIPSVKVQNLDTILVFDLLELYSNMNIIGDVKELYSMMSSKFLQMIVDPTISRLIRKHINECLQLGLDYTPKEHADSLEFKVNLLISGYVKKVAPNKTKYIEFLKVVSSTKHLENLFEIFRLLTNFKISIMSKLDTENKDVKVFLTDENYTRFVATNHEGYVISYDNTVVKLVDRTIFSSENFKNWR